MVSQEQPTVAPAGQWTPGPARGDEGFAMLLPLLLAAAAQHLPGKGEPAITAQTQKSGGPVDPEQAKLRFDAADLRFEVLPDTQTLNAVATLDFTATAPLTTLVIDLDHNLGPRQVAIDNVPLPRSAWSDPAGQLRVALPHAVAAGGHVTARIVYGGQPHVAVNAPWDDGMVWARTPDGRPWFATTSEGYGCDLFWPCLDHPTGEPGVVTLHVTVPKGLKAPSNGVLLGVDDAARRADAMELADQAPQHLCDRAQRRAVRGDRGAAIAKPLRQHDPDVLLVFARTEERECGESTRAVRRICADAGLLRKRRRPISVGRREGRGGGDAAQGHGAPDDQRLRQWLCQGAGGVRLAVPARVRPRMVRQPADRRQLGRLLAARGLRGIHAAALRPVARRRGALRRDDGRSAEQGAQQGADRQRAAC